MPFSSPQQHVLCASGFNNLSHPAPTSLLQNPKSPRVQVPVGLDIPQAPQSQHACRSHPLSLQPAQPDFFTADQAPRRQSPQNPSFSCPSFEFVPGSCQFHPQAPRLLALQFLPALPWSFVLALLLNYKGHSLAVNSFQASPTF